MKKISNYIEVIKFGIKEITFIHIFREANKLVDNLPKVGVI